MEGQGQNKVYVTHLYCSISFIGARWVDILEENRSQSGTRQIYSRNKYFINFLFELIEGSKVNTNSMLHIYIAPLVDWYQVETSAEPFWRSK